MSESKARHQQRIAENEIVFRELNERIEAGRMPGASRTLFRCECARLGCTQLLELDPAEYERVRSEPRRFVLIAGHEVPDSEVVVESFRGYAVVEKIEIGGDIAEAHDPRPQ